MRGRVVLRRYHVQVTMVRGAGRTTEVLHLSKSPREEGWVAIRRYYVQDTKARGAGRQGDKGIADMDTSHLSEF